MNSVRATWPAGYGYYDVTTLPYGGHFRRPQSDLTITIEQTCKHREDGELAVFTVDGVKGKFAGQLRFVRLAS